jgi:hypothetical protein
MRRVQHPPKGLVEALLCFLFDNRIPPGVALWRLRILWIVHRFLLDSAIRESLGAVESAGTADRRTVLGVVRSDLTPPRSLGPKLLAAGPPVLACPPPMGAFEGDRRLPSLPPESFTA